MSEMKNPIVPGWYADPEAMIVDGTYWIYVTRSHTDYKQQMNLDAFHSVDLIHWTKHEGIIEMNDFPWIWRAVWAPSMIEHRGKYYLIFASNDIQSNEEIGGLEIAVADHPAGPFRGYLGKPLIDRFIHDAQPIDAHFFKDDDGTIYVYYGGWSHCNVAKMNDNMTGFEPIDHQLETILPITPPGYCEGPCMLKKDGKYMFMWSKGNWVNESYCVAYGVSASPTGPFVEQGVVLQSQPPIAEGPGHHSYLYIADADEWLIVYHRRIIGDTDPGSRVLCIDRMHIDHTGIHPVTMTNTWEKSW
jgi:beta-xylosidase